MHCMNNIRGRCYLYLCECEKDNWGCGEAIWDESEIWLIDGSSVLVDEAVVKERLHFRFEAELSPVHRLTSTVHYRVFKRRLAGASLFKGGVHVRTTTTCTLSAMARPFR